ncbi:hypothetical protein K502DRAFT_367267 [Neoconidiobolus thromboides FSU 785]|nr:hypothetical protein K502DRAFT_367267 [Neoconidiobolus thromboides FSU 785]
MPLKPQSYKDAAVKRIVEIERILKSSMEIISMNNSTSGNRNNPHLITITNYLRWLNYILNKYLNLIKIKKKIQRRRNGLVIYNKEVRLFGLETELGIKNFMEFVNNDIQHPSEHSLIALLPMDLMRDFNLSVNTFNGLKPSQLIECFINLYSNKLDTESFWLTKEMLIKILKCQQNTLVKMMLLQTFNKLIQFDCDQLEKLINISEWHFNNLVVEALEKGDLMSLTGITLLCWEFYFSAEIKSANIYLLEIMKMKEKLKIQNNKIHDKMMAEWQKNIFELVDFICLLIIGKQVENKEKWKEVNKKDEFIKFQHINNKLLCLPTKVRKCKIEDATIIKTEGLHLILNLDNNDKKPNEDEFQKKYYLFATWIDLEVLQLKLNCNYNTQQIDNYIKLILNQLTLTPSNYKIYTLITKEQTNSLLIYGKHNIISNSDNTSFGTYAYLILNLNCLYLVQPLLFNNCSNQSKLDTIPGRYLQLSYQITSNLYELLSTIINTPFEKKEIYYLLMNNLRDFLPLFKYYFIIIKQENVSKEIKSEFISNLNFIYSYLNGCYNSKFGFKDTNYVYQQFKLLIKLYGVEQLFNQIYI